jgi:hypothetical protein
MASSWMLRGVGLVRADVSEELSASIIRVARIGELGTTLAVTGNRRTGSPILFALMRGALSSSETFVLTRATWRISQKTPNFNPILVHLDIGRIFRRFKGKPLLLPNTEINALTFPSHISNS